ncbi:MAG TPA: putative metal-dependent hydrolase [Vicinamibacterales bacterium]|nr:putative metal-dependent hydrolase [Vicinamibacterales bacterium]
MTDIEALKYPVGRMSRVETPLDRATRERHLKTLEDLPERVRTLVSALDDARLDTPYRPGGWTIRQVVHHVPDSHLNAYVRMKLAATEDAPTIRTYEEQLWAELPEAKRGPVAMSLDLLSAVHRRWLAFLRGLPEADLQRVFVHPAWGRVAIDEAISMYAWHSRHHTAHIEQALGLPSPAGAR